MSASTWYSGYDGTFTVEVRSNINLAGFTCLIIIALYINKMTVAHLIFISTFTLALVYTLWYKVHVH